MIQCEKCIGSIGNKISYFPCNSTGLASQSGRGTACAQTNATKRYGRVGWEIDRPCPSCFPLTLSQPLSIVSSTWALPRKSLPSWMKTIPLSALRRGRKCAPRRCPIGPRMCWSLTRRPTLCPKTDPDQGCLSRLLRPGRGWGRAGGRRI